MSSATSRRKFLAGSAALGAAGLLLPRVARAVAPEDRKFLFVWADGGWDVTQVFAPVFSAAVERTADDEPAHAGALRYVSNPRRPVVDAFYQATHDRMALVDGLLVRSVNHPICRSLWMTGSPSAARPDWPTLIGHAAADRYTVPHFIVRGFSMAGDLSAFTAYSGTGASLEMLMSGAANVDAKEPYRPFSLGLSELLDDVLVERTAARLATARTDVEHQVFGAHHEAASRLVDFKVVTEGLSLATGDDFAQQTELAVTVLSQGVSRCVQMMSSGVWDTHGNNAPQSGLFEGLFYGLGYLLQRLETTPGTHGGTLLDETTVVVMSEMGRTPHFNVSMGRDHWMYTSALFMGSGIRGGTQLGGFDAYLNGRTVDPATGELAAGGVPITPDAIGSTLLTLAGIDPRSVLGADSTLWQLLT
jgi:uncharacterized protein (DUF1501 family)